MDKIKQIQLTNIILIILLIVGLLWTIQEFRAISKTGLMCAKSPFVYGAQEISKKYENSSVFCSCVMDSGRSFAFNTTTFIPGVREISPWAYGIQTYERINNMSFFPQK